MTWLLLVALMAMADEDVTSVFDYLGRNQPLTQPKLALSSGGTGGGAVTAPISGAGPGQTVQQGGTLSGGGTITQTGSFPVSGAIDLAKNLLKPGEQQPPGDTRGDTGNQSLSDQVRSGAAAAGNAAGIDPSTPAGAAVSAATEANSAAPASVIAPASGSGLGGITGGASAGGNLALDSGANIATDAATAGAEQAVESAALTLPSVADAFTGVLTSGLIPIVESFFGTGPLNSDVADIFHPKDPFAETKGIRKDFSKAIDPFLGGSATYGKLAQVDSLPKEKQAEALQQILQESNYELAQGPAVSHFQSTGGGAVKGLVKPVDTSALDKVSGTQSADAVLAQTAALDKLSALGVTPDMSSLGISDVWANPNGILGVLLAQGGVKLDPAQGDYTSMLTPGELSALAQPGERMKTIQGILTRLNPDFANSPLGQSMGTSPGSASPPAEQPGSSLSPSAAPSITSASGPAGALGFADNLLQNQ